MTVDATNFEAHSWLFCRRAASNAATGPGTAFWGMTTSELLTLAFAALSVVVAGIGAWLANQRARAGETTAREALDDARQARGRPLSLRSGRPYSKRLTNSRTLTLPENLLGPGWTTCASG